MYIFSVDFRVSSGPESIEKLKRKMDISSKVTQLNRFDALITMKIRHKFLVVVLFVCKKGAWAICNHGFHAEYFINNF